MEAALEFSFYALAAAVVLGVLMTLVLARDVFFHRRFHAPPSAARRVPSTALDAARAALAERKAALADAGPELEEALRYEVRHLEHRIEMLEDQAFEEQAPYHDACKARERVWREWHAAYRAVRKLGYLRGGEQRRKLETLRKEFATLTRTVEAEFHRAVARDALALESLHSQGVLVSEVLRMPRTARMAGADVRPEHAHPQHASGQGGRFGQAELAQAAAVKSGRTYADATLRTSGLPKGALSRADLSRSTLAGVRFVGVQRFVGCRFVEADLRRIELPAAEAPHLFQDCDLRGALLTEAHLARVVFLRCDLSGTHWGGARLERVRLERCTVEQVHWEGADLRQVTLSEDMLATADFSDAGAPPRVRSEVAAPAPSAQPDATTAPASDADSSSSQEAQQPAEPSAAEPSAETSQAPAATNGEGEMSPAPSPAPSPAQATTAKAVPDAPPARDLPHPRRDEG